MRKTLLAFLLILTSTATFAAAPASELTGKTMILGDRITVGDLFTNAGSNSSHVLAPAPDVGKSLVLSRDDLMRVVTAFHLDWTPPAGDATVSLQRDAVAVTPADIIDALGKSELKNQISADASFQLIGISHSYILDGHDPVSLTVTDTAFEPANEHFTATIHLLRNGKEVENHTIDGNATAMIRIPVLTGFVSPGETMGKNEISEITVAKRSLHGDIILTADELSGMMARRTLQANQPISRNDIMPPLLIKRNELVTVTYQNGPIVLSTKARALGDGTKGDTITFMNASSKKPFDAVVTGPQQAQVTVASL